MEDLVSGSPEGRGLACRFCGAPLSQVFVDLGASPLANSYLEPEDLDRAEAFYPLRVYVCGECLLVQLPEAERPEAIFSDYAYFSSYSESWLRHAEAYVEAMIARFVSGADGGAGAGRRCEIASNDGYLLQYFRRGRSRCWASSRPPTWPAAAEAEGHPDGGASSSAWRPPASSPPTGKRADLLVGNNVLAHVPDLNDFVAGHEDPAGPARGASPWSSRT